MKLKELKGKIVYFTMLISMILTFLGLINNSISNVDTGVILLIHIILLTEIPVLLKSAENCRGTSFIISWTEMK